MPERTSVVARLRAAVRVERALPGRLDVRLRRAAERPGAERRRNRAVLLGGGDRARQARSAQRRAGGQNAPAAQERAAAAGVGDAWRQRHRRARAAVRQGARPAHPQHPPLGEAARVQNDRAAAGQQQQQLG